MCIRDRLELDFRNIGVEILKQVMEEVNRFHTDINYDNLILLSSITSLDKDATHLMSLVNPLVCVRGYSEEGEGTTILQLIYSADNVGFSTYEINLDEIDADIEREIKELETINVTQEEIAAAQFDIDENNEEMSEMFMPNFGLKTPETKPQKQKSNKIKITHDDK